VTSGSQTHALKKRTGRMPCEYSFKESESEIFEKSDLESDILPPTPQPWFFVTFVLSFTQVYFIVTFRAFQRTADDVYRCRSAN